jgi:uracil-DNA glycosylase family 4
MNPGKDKTFSILVREVHACRKCDRMRDSARVLSFAAGNLNARVMFIGEAPGRLGADQTEIPFHGDASGNNFEEFLAFAGLRRDAVFVTNAALCNPKGDRGNNATPNPLELQNCSGFLRRQIQLVDPAIVVTLGSVALRATDVLESHGLELSKHVRTATRWFGRTIVPLYHPGQRAMVHRSVANQRSDYQFVAELVHRQGQIKNAPGGKTKADVLTACKYLLSTKGPLSYFELHKLVYLAEYLHVRQTGERLTSAFFIRQKDGPYCTDLHLARLKRSDPSISSVKQKGKLFVTLAGGSGPQLILAVEAPAAELKRTLDEVIARYSFSNEADLKKAVYLTAPMRLILRREKQEKLNLYNAPIDFMAARAE